MGKQLQEDSWNPVADAATGRSAGQAEGYMYVLLRSHSNAVKISPLRHNVRATQRWHAGTTSKAASLCRMLSIEFRRADNAVSHSDSLLFRFGSVLRLQASNQLCLGMICRVWSRLTILGRPQTIQHLRTTPALLVSCGCNCLSLECCDRARPETAMTTVNLHRTPPWYAGSRSWIDARKELVRL